MGNELSPKAGIRFMVHDRDLMPSPLEQGFDLQPSTSSSVSIQRVGSCKTMTFPGHFLKKTISNRRSRGV